MLRHTLILSDVHLTTLVRDRPDGWLAYRRPELAPDELLARVIKDAHAEARRQFAFFELILAGDLFDLDAPPACGDASAASFVVCRSDAGAECGIGQAFADHPAVVQALASVLADGTSRVVFVPGNHDAQLAFLGVRRAIVQALGAQNAPGRLLFRSWFHRSQDRRIIVEHGHQYDPLCVMERMFALVGPDGQAVLENTVGSVGTHFGQSLFGLMNPYASDPFEMAAGGARALRACIGRAASDRALGAGAFAAFRELVLVGTEEPDAVGQDAWLAFVARETGASRVELERHLALWAPKANAGDLARAATRTYDYGAEVASRLSSSMHAIADIYDRTQAVVAGHTHEPYVYTDEAGRVFANPATGRRPRAPTSPSAPTFFSSTTRVA